MASQCIESIHYCHFQPDTQCSSSRRRSENSCSRISISRSRANLSLIGRVFETRNCCKKNYHGPLKKLQTRSIIASSLSASEHTFTPPATAEKLDQWMKQSIIEIVKHIQDAPFLHYVFDIEQSPSARRWQKVPASTNYISQEQEQEQEQEESWGILRNCITRICPDGMIYVQKLNSECKCENCNTAIARRGSESELEQSSTELWGLVIQGRGGGFSGCSSYILKTTQIVSPNGCWTQFSLVRAKCFCECPSTQFIRSWLF